MPSVCRSEDCSLLYRRIALTLLALCSIVMLPSISLARQVDLAGPAGSESFGTAVVVLANGNIVIADPYYDAPGPIEDVGAVYLYGPDGMLISTLTGSSANDQVGSGNSGIDGITMLSNGHLVVSSPFWSDGAISAAGAATWIDGTSGLSGTVSAINSVVGSSVNDNVGQVVTRLPNGHYVVSQSRWDNGAVMDAGSVTWGNGEGGTVGTVSASNSLVGTTATDQISNFGVVALGNGNYLVSSPNWNDGVAADVGAVTWGNGAVGTVGVVSAVNSLVGSSDFDNIGTVPGGQVGLIELSDSDYVVVSTSWNDGAVSDAGAVTWGSGNAGVSGVVSSSNSLVGSTDNDLIGSSGVIALSNGHYVVNSALWNNGGISNAGASTWGDGNAGSIGAVSGANSLIGSQSSDGVGGGGAVALSNGHYVVVSPNWRNGGFSEAGAVTWVDGNSGLVDTVSVNNSLVGSSANDRIGSDQIDATTVALTNGHYAVASPLWNDGGTADVGAVTWGDGDSGTTGVINSSNSLLGSSANDQVGEQLIALGTGHYVVGSPQWDNAGTVNVGAATWGNGNSGTAGPVSDSNSLIGTVSGDRVGETLTALSNGNYVAGNGNIDIGGVSNTGALVWADGNIGLSGTVSAANALYGDEENYLGDENAVIYPLSNGNLVVYCAYCSIDGIFDVGAMVWMDGATGTTGPVDEASRLHGRFAGDFDASEVLIAYGDGNYAFRSADFDFASGDGSTQGPLTSLNSVLGGLANNGDSLLFDYDPAREQLVVARPNENIVSLFVFPLGTTMNVAAGAVAIADDGACSLREAIHNANADTQVDNADCPAGDGNDTLVLASGDYLLSDADADDDANGLPIITSGIRLESDLFGPPARILRDTTAACNLNGVNNAGEFRLFQVRQDGDLTLNDLTLANGCADGGGNYNDGGAIKVGSNGRLNLIASRIQSSSALDKSGGIDISNDAVVNVIDSTISNNSGLGGAGGIGHGGRGLLTIERSLIDANYAEGLGGAGIGSFSGTTTRILNSTISRNYAASGPGGGGGIGNQGTIEIISSTFAGNSSDGDLGGSSIGNAGGTVALKNNLIVLQDGFANTLGASDCANLSGGSYIVEGVVLTNGSGGCSAANAEIITVSTAALGADDASSNMPPNDLGGITAGYPISPVSVALDAADDCTDFDGNAVTEDQRPIARPDGDMNVVCDVGAFEFTADDAVTQTISFGGNPGPFFFGGTGGSANATADSGLAVTYGTTTPAVCAVHDSSGVITLLGAGDCVVTANQTGNFYYQAAPEATQIVIIDKTSQTIGFGTNPGPLTLIDSASVAATASSGLPVRYASTTAGVCDVDSSNGALMLFSAGDCIVTADQDGNMNVFPAAQVMQTVVITKASQTISFAMLPDRNLGEEPSTLSASGGGSSQPVTFAAQSPSICETSGSNGSTLTLLAVGICQVRASQAGDAEYLAAADVERGFMVLDGNEPPTIGADTQLTLLEDGENLLSIVVGDDATAVGDLQLTAQSSNQMLFTDAALNAALAGSDSARSLSLEPLADAFGSTTVTLTVDDGSATNMLEIFVEVLPVNDPPTASELAGPSHASGTSGAQSVLAFVTAITGPLNESVQNVQYELRLDDPSALLGTVTLSPAGRLDYTLSGGDGVAWLHVTPIDDGGTANGGLDKGVTQKVSIIVGSGAALDFSIQREQPGDSLLQARAKGLTLANYQIVASNDGDQLISGLRLLANDPVALVDTVWTCEADATSCVPGAGIGAIDAVVDLPAGLRATLDLSGEIDDLQDFMEIVVEATVPSGVTLLPGSRQRVVLIEAVSARAVFKSGFE